MACELVWDCWHFRQLKTWIHDNDCDLAIKSDTGLDSVCNSCDVSSSSVCWLVTTFAIMTKAEVNLDHWDVLCDIPYYHNIFSTDLWYRKEHRGQGTYFGKSNCQNSSRGYDDDEDDDDEDQDQDDDDDDEIYRMKVTGSSGCHRHRNRHIFQWQMYIPVTKCDNIPFPPETKCGWCLQELWGFCFETFQSSKTMTEAFPFQIIHAPQSTWSSWRLEWWWWWWRWWFEVFIFPASNSS